MNQPWNMAKARSRQRLTPLKYKPVAPIGEKQDCATAEMRERCLSRRDKEPKSIHLAGEVSTCFTCGYHVCSCKPALSNERLANANGNTRSCMRHAMFWDANVCVGCPNCLAEQRELNHEHLAKLKACQEYIDRMEEIEESRKQLRQDEYFARLQQQYMEQYVR